MCVAGQEARQGLPRTLRRPRSACFSVRDHLFPDLRKPVLRREDEEGVATSHADMNFPKLGFKVP